MEFMRSTADWMGLVTSLTVPVLLIAAGCIGFVLSGAAARAIEHLAPIAARRAGVVPTRRPEPAPTDARRSLVGSAPGSVADPVRMAS